jgi:hypothetical protein
MLGLSKAGPIIALPFFIDHLFERTGFNPVPGLFF